MRASSWWKLAGLAGVVVGVAATGAVIARDERQRRAYTPDEVRERLHARYADVAGTVPDGPAEVSAVAGTDGSAPRGRVRAALARLALRGRGRPSMRGGRR